MVGDHSACPGAHLRGPAAWSSARARARAREPQRRWALGGPARAASVEQALSWKRAAKAESMSWPCTCSKRTAGTIVITSRKGGEHLVALHVQQARGT